MDVFDFANSWEWELCMWRRAGMNEAVYNRMMDNYVRLQQQETFFRPWEHPAPNQPANIAVVRPFQLNQNVLSTSPRVTSPRENLHKKLLRGNHIQYQHRYQQQQQQQQNHVNYTSQNVNHDPESVILSRPLFLETSSNEPETTKQEVWNTQHPSKLDPDLEDGHELIICEESTKTEHSDVDSDSEVDCESVSSSSSSSSQPLDLRTTKIPYSSTAEYEISVIRSLTPVSGNKTPGSSSKESTKERKSRKLKTKRRICTACNRTYLKTKNLRWHFKSKLHLKRVSKLGIDDPANQPDTWYRTTSEQHDNSPIFFENNIQDDSNY